MKWTAGIKENLRLHIQENLKGIFKQSEFYSFKTTISLLNCKLNTMLKVPSFTIKSEENFLVIYRNKNNSQCERKRVTFILSWNNIPYEQRTK